MRGGVIGGRRAPYQSDGHDALRGPSDEICHGFEWKSKDIDSVHIRNYVPRHDPFAPVQILSLATHKTLSADSGSHHAGPFSLMT